MKRCGNSYTKICQAIYGFFDTISCMASHERPTEQPEKPSVDPLQDPMSRLEHDLLEGDYDWSLIQPSSNLLQIRKGLIQSIQKESPDWDKTRVVRTAAKVETVLKVARLEQLSQIYGESDERVLQLREDIDYWRALLGTQPPPQKRK